MIVDAHTHLLPDRLAAKIRQFFVDRAAPSLLYPWEHVLARAALQAAGVGRCWTLPYAHRGGVGAGLNRWMTDTFRDDPFVVPGATVHPDDDVDAVVAEAAGPLGLRVFKLHCSVGRFVPDDPRLDPLWRRVSRDGQPVVVHCGAAAEGTAAPEDLSAVSRAAARFPDARIVVAHFGAPSVGETLDLLARHRSVYADLTPVVADPVGVDPRALRGLERRILFGSDAPTVAVPIESSIARVRGWGLAPEDEAAILGATALALVPAPPR